MKIKELLGTLIMTLALTACGTLDISRTTTSTIVITGKVTDVTYKANRVTEVEVSPINDSWLIQKRFLHLSEPSTFLIGNVYTFTIITTDGSENITYRQGK